MSNLWLRFPSNVRRFIRVVLIDTKPKPKAALHEWSRHRCLPLAFSWCRAPSLSFSPLLHLPPLQSLSPSLSPSLFSASSCSLRAADFMRIVSTSQGSSPSCQFPSLYYTLPPLSLSLPSPLCAPNCITYKIKQCQASKIDESPKSNRKGKRSKGRQVGCAGGVR